MGKALKGPRTVIANLGLIILNVMFTIGLDLQNKNRVLKIFRSGNYIRILTARTIVYFI